MHTNQQYIGHGMLNIPVSRRLSAVGTPRHRIVFSPQRIDRKTKKGVVRIALFVDAIRYNFFGRRDFDRVRGDFRLIINEAVWYVDLLDFT